MTLTLKKAIRADSKYTKFKEIMTKELGRIDLEADITELKTLHQTRQSRVLYGNKNKYSANVLMEASLQDLSARSRMVEIRVSLSNRLAVMESAIKAFSRYIYVEYVLNDPNYTTEAQRNNFISDVLVVWKEKVERGKIVLEMADAFIKDIDQAGYNLRNMMDCLKLLSETAGKVI